MPNDYYDSSGTPASGASGASAPIRAEFDAIEAGFAKLPTLTGNGGKAVVVNSGGTALEATNTFTDKRFTWRVNALPDAASITPAGDTTDAATHVNTQALGTLTVNAPTGTPTNAQRLVLRIKSTNAHALSFNAIYRGAAELALPVALSGASKTDYLGFLYNSADAKWDLLATAAGYS